MTKTIYIIILILVFLSFGKKENYSDSERKSFYYPNPKCFEVASNKVFLDLKEISSYNELMNRLDSIVCNDKSPVIRYGDSYSDFNLIPSHKCPNRAIVCCYKERNRVKITNDSIYSFFRSHSMDSLPFFVKKHIQNNGADYRYSNSPQSAFFEIEMDSLISIDKIEEILIGISESFNEVNSSQGDSLSLNIRIGVKKIIEVRPPPPAPKPLFYKPKN